MDKIESVAPQASTGLGTDASIRPFRGWIRAARVIVLLALCVASAVELGASGTPRPVWLTFGLVALIVVSIGEWKWAWLVERPLTPLEQMAEIVAWYQGSCWLVIVTLMAHLGGTSGWGLLLPLSCAVVWFIATVWLYGLRDERPDYHMLPRAVCSVIFVAGLTYCFGVAVNDAADKLDPVVANVVRAGAWLVAIVAGLVVVISVVADYVGRLEDDLMNDSDQRYN